MARLSENLKGPTERPRRSVKRVASWERDQHVIPCDRAMDWPLRYTCNGAARYIQLSLKETKTLKNIKLDVL